MYSKPLLPLFLIICSFTAVSCLTGAEEDVPSQYAVNLHLEDVGSIQITEEDTLQIVEVSFLQGRIALHSGGSDSTLLFQGPGVFLYQYPDLELQALLTGNLKAGTYQSMAYQIEKAEANNENIPSEFIDGEADDERYSMIITGVYNSKEFTYKSVQSFSYNYDLGSSVEIPEHNTSATFVINFAVNQAFLNADSTGFLDPTVAENAGQIDSNIEAAIELLQF